MNFLETLVYGYRRIFGSGVEVVNRSNLNFDGAGVTVADDPANDRTNVTIAGAGGGVSGYDTKAHAGSGQEVGALTGYFGVVDVRGTAVFSFGGTTTSTGLLRFPVQTGSPIVYAAFDRGDGVNVPVLTNNAGSAGGDNIQLGPDACAYRNSTRPASAFHTFGNLTDNSLRLLQLDQVAFQVSTSNGAVLSLGGLGGDGDAGTAGGGNTGNLLVLCNGDIPDGPVGSAGSWIYTHSGCLHLQTQNGSGVVYVDANTGGTSGALAFGGSGASVGYVRFPGTGGAISTVVEIAAKDHVAADMALMSVTWDGTFDCLVIGDGTAVDLALYGCAVEHAFFVGGAIRAAVVSSGLQLPDGHNIALGATAPAMNSATDTVFVANGTAPTGNPTGGGYLYCAAGAGKWRGSSGTITTIGPADLEGFGGHCPACGTDFAHEWSNDKYGSLTVCMRCLADELGERPWIIRKPARS